MKKTILTNEIKKWNLLSKLIYLSPLALFLYTIIPSLKRFNGAGNTSPDAKSLFFWFIIIAAISLSIPIIFSGRLIIEKLRRRAMKNASFDSVEDIDYYRDRLEGLRPVDISYLTDMKLEVDKDITGQILQYELWDVIEENNGQINIKNLTDKRLKESDKYLINYLASKEGNLETWKEMVHDKMKKSKYFIYKKKGKSKWMTLSNVLFYLGILPFLGLGFYIGYDMISNNNQILNSMDLIADFKFDSLVNIPNYFWTYTILFILVGLVYALPAASLLIFLLEIKDRKNPYELERTSKGNRITELIYGLKNFIKDFTLLSERDKKSLALWDDFLVYAVVLEENSQIIDEIKSYRRQESSRV